MKTHVLIILVLLALMGCESELQINTDVFEPTPAIYCLIDPMDSVHYVRVERSYSSNDDPASSSQIGDSIYPSEVSVDVFLIGFAGDTTFVKPEIDYQRIKEDGFFNHKDHFVYSFRDTLAINKTPLYKTIAVEVEIPGLPVAKGSSDFLSRPHVRWPYVAQQYLYMDSTRPILVQWHGGDWNEVDIQFSVMEQYKDSTVVQYISFEEMTEVIRVDEVVQVTFPYDLVVDNYARMLDPRKQLIRRYFGPVYVKIHTGNIDFANYMQCVNGMNDFTGRTFSNVENGIGMVACNWTYAMRPLVFDYFTRSSLAEDSRLKPFKFIEY